MRLILSSIVVLLMLSAIIVVSISLFFIANDWSRGDDYYEKQAIRNSSILTELEDATHFVREYYDQNQNYPSSSVFDSKSDECSLFTVLQSQDLGKNKIPEPDLVPDNFRSIPDDQFLLACGIQPHHSDMNFVYYASWLQKSHLATTEDSVYQQYKAGSARRNYILWTIGGGLFILGLAIRTVGKKFSWC